MNWKLWGGTAGNIGAALLVIGMLGILVATALVGAGATVWAWRWFRAVVGF